jgi:hypothetical protein
MAAGDRTNKELLILTTQKLDTLIETVGGLSSEMKTQNERIHTIENNQAADCVKINNLVTEDDQINARIGKIDDKINNWSTINSLGALIASILGYFGVQK